MTTGNPPRTPADRDRAQRRLSRITTAVAISAAAGSGAVAVGLAATAHTGSATAGLVGTTRTTTSDRLGSCRRRAR